MGVTIKAVAERAGLSLPTVSHILNGRGSFRPETREKVMAVVEELGYRPNGSAKAIRSGRFGCAALVLSTRPHHSSLSTGLLHSIHDALAERDLHLTLARLPDERLTSEGVIPKILREWTADGLLINYIASIPQRMIELLREYDIPSIWINSKQPWDGVYPDDDDAARRATEHLLKLGHRRIAYVDYSHPAGSTNHYSSTDRQAGYVQAMRKARLAPHIIRPEYPLPRGQRIDFSMRWLARGDRPTAVVTYSGTVALPVIHAASVQLDLNVPRDLSVITFGEQVVDESGLPIDTMMIPEHGLGYTAVRMLMEKIEKPQVPLSSIVLAFAFEAGRTCAPAATAA